MDPESLLLAERYLLHSAIARGGMATVWRARDEVLARTVAVKILHPHLSDDESFLERFRREAYAAARLTHPNIVSIYDTGFDRDEHEGERHYIVMEYCGGGTLAGMAKDSGGRLPPEQLGEIAIAVCDALEYAHASGIIHRDIKPANVLRSETGALKVGDFGIAKAAADAGDITTTGTILGTVTYLSPEQARGEEPDARSDLYSLGIVLYEQLVGRVPFQADSQVATALMHLNDVPPPPRSIVPSVPKELEGVVMKALAKEPDDRYGSAGEMRDALFSAVGRPGTMVMRVPPRETPASSPTKSRSEMRWLLPVLLLIGLAVAAVFIVPGLLTDEQDAEPGTPTRTEPQTLPPIDIVSGTSFDPDGDGTEHEEEVPQAFDGDKATTWSTEDYVTAFSAQKAGVGILLDLGSSKEVAALELRTSTPGLGLEIRSADRAPQTLEETKVATSVEVLENGTVELDEPVESQFWLLWITRLPNEDVGSAEIAEVEFRSE